MVDSTKIMMLASSPSTAQLIEAMLDSASKPSFALEKLDDLTQGIKRLALGDIAVILLDLDLTDSDLHLVLDQLQSVDKTIPIIIIAASDKESQAIEAVELGAFVYLLLENLQPRWLAQSIVSALERAASNRQIAQLTAELKQAKEQASDAARHESQFLSDMSHEIRTPMNSVIGMTDLLRRSPLNRDQQKFVEIIQNSAKVLLDVINDILTFSKLEKGKFVLQIQVFDLRKLVEGVADILSEKAREKNIYLTTFISPDVPSLVNGDPQRLRQVFLQLAANAIKYSDGGKVELRVLLEKRNGDQIKIIAKVSDQGRGLAHSQAELLFSPAAQEERICQATDSQSGFGLVICKRIIESMGGAIWLTSELGIGSNFYFTANLVKAPSNEGYEFDGRELRGRRLLFGNLQELDRQTLEEYSSAFGIAYDIAASLEEVPSLVDNLKREGQNYQLVVLDLVKSEPESIKHLVSFLAEKQQDVAVIRPLEEVRHVERLFELQLAHELSWPLKQSQFATCLTNAINIDGQSLAADQETRFEDELLKTAKFDLSQRILVVEDNQINREVVKLQLRSLGLKPLLVAGGRQALEELEKQHYHFILMDCQMPQMDGYQATRKIRELQEGKSERSVIIALTANALIGDREKCLNAGMDDFMSKPVTIEKLGHTLLKWQATLSKADAVLQTSADKEHTHKISSSDGANAQETLNNESARRETEDELDLSFLRDNLITTYGEEAGESIFQLFCSSTPELIQQLETAWSVRDWTALRNKAHELKGQCSMVQADKLAALCKELEQFIKSEERAMVERVLVKLRASYENAKVVHP